MDDGNMTGSARGARSAFLTAPCAGGVGGTRRRGRASSSLHSTPLQRGTASVPRQCSGAAGLPGAQRALDTRRRSSSAVVPYMGRRGASQKGKSARPEARTNETLQVMVEDASFDTFRVEPAAEILREGGLGVIPTDTSYAFVCSLHSKAGVERIYSLKNVPSRTKKPLSLLCRDMSSLQKYVHTLSRSHYKLLKATLPGPYTYILPATSEVPRVISEHKSIRKTWKRKEIGVRICDDPYCVALLSLLDEPLLCSSVPMSADSSTLMCDASEIAESWCKQVDFVVNAGERRSKLSTVVDLTTEPPTILRVGEGAVELIEDG